MATRIKQLAVPRACLAGYFILALLPLTLCFARPFDPPLCYPRGDLAQTLWNFWWFDQTFWSLKNPYNCPVLFHPFGGYLYLHTMELVDALVTAPARWIGGVELGWKVALALHSFWTAVAAHLLARRLGVRPWGAVVCAVVLTTTSYRTLSVVALSLQATGHAFFLAWAVAGCLREPRRLVHGAWLGLASVLLLFSNLYYLFFVVLLAAAAALTLCLVRRPDRRAWAGWLRQGALATAIGAGPLIFLALGAHETQGHLGAVSKFDAWTQIRGSADLIQLFMPACLRPVLDLAPSSPLPPYLRDPAPRGQAISFLPPLVFLLPGLWMALRGGESRTTRGAGFFRAKLGLRREVGVALVVVMTLAVFLALGPEIRAFAGRNVRNSRTIAPRQTPLEDKTSGNRSEIWPGAQQAAVEGSVQDYGLSAPSPYAWLSGLPVFRHIRECRRAGYFYLAALVLLLANPFEQALRAMVRKFRERGVNPALTLGVFGAVLFLEQPIFFYPTQLRIDRSGLERIRDLPGAGGVAVYPGVGYWVQGLAMYDQIVHQRPLLGGYVSRDPLAYNDWMRGRAWNVVLGRVVGGRPDPLSPEDRAAFFEQARSDGLRFIVIYKNLFVGEKWRDFQAYVEANDLGRWLWSSEIMAVAELRTTQDRGRTTEDE
jgi:hypothetical protein